MVSDFSERIAQALQSEVESKEDALIRQAYRAGYAAAQGEMDRVLQKGLYIGVNETVKRYEKILAGQYNRE